MKSISAVNNMELILPKSKNVRVKVPSTCLRQLQRRKIILGNNIKAWMTQEPKGKAV